MRALRGRTLLKRVIHRTAAIWMPEEVMGVTDAVMQLGEVVATDSRDFSAGSLVVYPSPREIDHFEWDGDTILVLPTYWVSAHVTDTFLADNPAEREYGRPLT